MNDVGQWKADAVADGWHSAPLYPPNGFTITSEYLQEINAAQLTKDGWVAFVLNQSKRKSIVVWGPDGLGVLPSYPYSWEKLQAGLRRCNYCGSENVSTSRVSFAGRCCSDCLPEQKRILEYPGWTN